MKRASRRLNVGKGLTMSPGGLTLVELVMGMVVTSMVFAALAAFTTAMGQNWVGADSPQSLPLTQAVVTTRLANVIRGARAVGVVWPGSVDASSTQVAGVMLWLKDGMNVNGSVQYADGKIELGELGWLEYDPSADTLRLYRSSESLTFSQSLSAKIAVSSALMANQNLPQMLKALGSRFLTSQVLATNVIAAKFSSRDPEDVGGRPSVEFTIILGQNGRQEVSYGNAALRNATTPSN